jgi:hypothetical protein
VNESERIVYLALMLLATCSFAACREQPSAAQLSPETPAAPQPLTLVPLRVTPLAPEVPPRFLDVARQSGIDFTFFNDEVEDRFFLPEVMGGGAAWLDYDLDGRLDLYLVNGGPLESPDPLQSEHINRLFRNGRFRFDDVTIEAAAGHGGFGQGCCVGDFDADGFPDLYVCNYGPNLLLKNNGDGTFQNVTDIAAVGDPQWGTSPAWVDLNDDALLDLFVTNYLDLNITNLKVCEYNGQRGYCGPGDYGAAADRGYLNNGDGTFTEASEALGLTAPNGKGLAISVTDFDGDGKPEIYVANDMVENVLYRRTGTGPELRYENVARTAGCAVSVDGNNEASMGVACADFDGDGMVDVFLTHYYSQKNTLYRNLGDLLFDDVSRRTRIAATSFETLGFGTVAFDYDLDGSQDLFVANGHVLGPAQEPNEMHPQLLCNDGSGRFEDISTIAGPYFEGLWLGRGAAGADYDNDGDVDLLVTHLHRPVALLRNETQSPHHFVGLDLRLPNRLPPLGGRVAVIAGNRRIVMPIVGGGSYLSSGDARLVVGLGRWERAIDVEVFWPSGSVELFEDLPIDQYWRITEGRRLATVRPPENH